MPDHERHERLETPGFVTPYAQEPLMIKVSYAPTPDVDLSVYVLAAVDEHLATFQRIRDLLRAGCTIDAGDRRALAADSVAVAARYASAMSKALDLAADFYAETAAGQLRTVESAGAL